MIVSQSSERSDRFPLQRSVCWVSAASFSSEEMPLLFLSPTLSREGSVLWEAERVHLEWKMDDCPNVQAQRAALGTAPVAPRSLSRPSPTHAKTTPSASGEDHTLGLRATASQQVPCSTREQSCTMQCDYPQSNQAHAVHPTERHES